VVYEINFENHFQIRDHPGRRFSPVPELRDMTLSTRPLLALALCLAACGGLGNPGDSASASNFTTAVPPWMGTESSGGTTGDGGTGTTGAPTTSTGTGGDGQTSDPTTGTSGSPPTPKLDLPPPPATTGEDDEDKDEDDEDKDEDDEDKDEDDGTTGLPPLPPG
jgi:hypothetical protein